MEHRTSSQKNEYTFSYQDFTCRYKLSDQFLGWLFSLVAGSKGVHRTVLVNSHLSWTPGTEVTRFKKYQSGFLKRIYHRWLNTAERYKLQGNNEFQTLSHMMISLLMMLGDRVTLSPAQGAELTPGPSAGSRAQYLP